MIKQYLIEFVDVTEQLLLFAIFVRVITSWVGTPPTKNRFIALIYEVTDPILNVFKRYIPPIAGMLDISPIVAYFVIDIISGILQHLINKLPPI